MSISSPVSQNGLRDTLVSLNNWSNGSSLMEDGMGSFLMLLNMQQEVLQDESSREWRSLQECQSLSQELPSSSTRTILLFNEHVIHFHVFSLILRFLFHQMSSPLQTQREVMIIMRIPPPTSFETRAEANSKPIFYQFTNPFTRHSTSVPLQHSIQSWRRQRCVSNNFSQTPKKRNILTDITTKLLHTIPNMIFFQSIT